MNTAARAAIRLGMDQGHIMLGVQNGFEGLAKGEVEEMKWMSVSGWASQGGSMLGTSRLVPQGSDLYAIARVIEDNHIEALLVIGGWNGYEARLHHARLTGQIFRLSISRLSVCRPRSTITCPAPS